MWNNQFSLDEGSWLSTGGALLWVFTILEWKLLLSIHICYSDCTFTGNNSWVIHLIAKQKSVSSSGWHHISKYIPQRMVVFIYADHESLIHLAGRQLETCKLHIVKVLSQVIHTYWIGAKQNILYQVLWSLQTVQNVMVIVLLYKHCCFSLWSRSWWFVFVTIPSCETRMASNYCAMYEPWWS